MDGIPTQLITPFRGSGKHASWMAHVDTCLDAGLSVLVGWSIDDGQHLPRDITVAGVQDELLWLEEARRRLTELRDCEATNGANTCIRHEHHLTRTLKEYFPEVGLPWPPRRMSKSEYEQVRKW